MTPSDGRGPEDEVQRAITIIPFGLAMLLGLVLAAIPQGPSNEVAYQVSVALVLLSVAAWMIARRLPSFLKAVPPLIYIVSLGFLTVADGGINSGLSALVLVPIVWTALYADPISGAVVVGAAAYTLLGISIASATSFAVDLRRSVLWFVMGLIVVFAIQHLRTSLGAAAAESRERLRQSELLGRAAKELTALQDPGSIIEVGTRLARDIASPPHALRRAAYFAVEDEIVRTLVEFDDAGSQTGRNFALADHPFFSEIVHTGTPRSGVLDTMKLGPGARRVAAETGVVAGAAVPISPRGSLHGILAVGARNQRLPAELFQRLISLGQIVELALGDANLKEQLAVQASTDPLTGLSNRRVLNEVVTHRGRGTFAYITVDIDNLKLINDTYGHGAGDSLIAETAHAVKGALRRDEMLARTGGDEFVAFLPSATKEEAHAAGERILQSVRSVAVDGVRSSVSVGVAAGGEDASPEQVLLRADEAMYRAKRQGGMRMVVD